MGDRFVAAIERDVVHARGADAVSFLQGQLSQDVAALATGGAAWSLLLQPSGKVDAWLRVARVGDDELRLDVDAGFGQAVIDRLGRFLLRTRCELELAKALPCAAVRGVDDTNKGLPIVWSGVSGYDLIDGGGAPPAGIAPGDEHVYERLRIASAVPAMGRELTPDTIPAEAGQWLIDASVSFTKGCFTGQELVARIDSRGGKVPRPIRIVAIDGAAAVGAEVSVDGSVVGRITSAVLDEDGRGTLALGPIARSVEPPAVVQVDGAAARVLVSPRP